MNLQEIFNETALLIHHDLTPEQMVNRINQKSRQLFREFPLPDKIYRFTTKSTPYYDLPLDCAEDRIRILVIGETEYEKLTPEIQSVKGPFCSVFVGKLYVNPNPVGKDAYLYYRPRHVNLTASNLQAVPSFPEDYHEIFVFDLAKFAAMTQRDVDLANNFQAEVDDLERRARKGLKKMGLRRVKETMIW